MRIGTLPHPTKIASENIPAVAEIKEEVESTQQDVSIPFQSKEVKAGDTVLSVVEELNTSKTTVSILTIIKDFEELNPSVKADSLQIGKVYKFPLY